jgi:hypothetical protein
MTLTMDISSYFDREYKGSNPMALMIVPRGEQPVMIDLDEPGWVQTYAELLAKSGTWHLWRKIGTLVFSMAVQEDERPFYLARHIRRTDGSPEVIAYGIGKLRIDGHHDHLWILPNGQICGGDDVEPLALSLMGGMTGG